MRLRPGDLVAWCMPEYDPRIGFVIAVESRDFTDDPLVIVMWPEGQFSKRITKDDPRGLDRLNLR